MTTGVRTLEKTDLAQMVQEGLEGFRLDPSYIIEMATQASAIKTRLQARGTVAPKVSPGV